MTPQYQAEATMIVNNRQDQTVSITNDQLVSAQKLVEIPIPLSLQTAVSLNRS